MDFPKMFEKGRIANLSIKNRIVMTAMGVALSGSNGEASPELIKYYEARARGGVGLIITEVTCIDEAEGRGMAHQLQMTDMKHIAALQHLADTLHSYGTKLFVQLHHPGKEGSVRLNGGKPLVAPSAIVNSSGIMPRELTTEEVQGLVQKFIAGAVLAQAGGADGVEVHAAHGYLINQFLTPRSNQRNDQYGGSFENRLRFATEIVSGIRNACPTLPISVRISADEFMPDGNRLDAGVKIAQAMVAAGANVINVSSGLYESVATIIEPYFYEEGWKKYLAYAIKQAVDVPVIAVDALKTPECAERLLEEGVSDFIGLGRSLLADPEWPNKAKQGKSDTIRNCIGCMQCFYELGLGRHISCAVNPQLGREHHFDSPPVYSAGRTAVVVGGGPGGMQAASTLAQRGFLVTLLEKNSCLGGALNYADKPPHKHLVTRIRDVMARELEMLGVTVQLNTAATAQLLKQLDPDTVIIATGARPIRPDIPLSGEVHTFEDVLSGDVVPSGRVIVVGAGLVGLETAEFLAERSCDVTVLEMTSVVGAGVYPSVVDLLKKNLAEHGAKILTRHKLISVAPGGAYVQTPQDKVEIPCDSVVLALGSAPERSVVSAIQAEFPEAFVIGDALRGRRMMEATAEGFISAFHA